MSNINFEMLKYVLCLFLFISDWLSKNIKIYAHVFVMKYSLVSQYYHQSLTRFRQREIISFDLQNMISSYFWEEQGRGWIEWYIMIIILYIYASTSYIYIYIWGERVVCVSICLCDIKYVSYLRFLMLW